MTPSPRSASDRSPVSGPPMFRAEPVPVLKRDQPWEGPIVSVNSGLVVEHDRWRLWYTSGVVDAAGESLKVCYAESIDEGRTWKKPRWPDAPLPGTNTVLPAAGESDNAYHASVAADGRDLVAYVWRRTDRRNSAMYRLRSRDGRRFLPDPDRPLIAQHDASAAIKRRVGEGRVSNDVFDVLRNADGSHEYFAAGLERAGDRRAVVHHDNAAGFVRLIVRATSPDGVNWSPTRVVLRPDYEGGDPFDTQFYGMQVFRRRGVYLGLLHTFWAESQLIQPEWAWSRDGEHWVRTRKKCISLGDEGTFDSCMILYGSLTVTGSELVWLYAGYDWRHNAFRHHEVGSAIGRAALSVQRLDEWLDSLAAS